MKRSQKKGLRGRFDSINAPALQLAGGSKPGRFALDTSSYA